MKKLIALLLVLSVVFSLCACGSKPEAAPAQSQPAANDPGTAAETEQYDTVKIMLSCNGTDLGNDTRTAKLFAERIAEKSGGKITVDVYNNDTLTSGNAMGAGELIVNGTVQMDLRSTTILATVCENLKVSTLPFVFEDYAEAREYTWGKGGEYYDKILGEIGLKYLGGVHNGLACFTCGKRQITCPDDIKGLKMRGAGEQQMDFYACLDAAAVSMSWAEVYTAMQQGTIDGHWNSLTTIYSNNIQEVQHYISLSDHVYELFIFTANQAWFDSLNEASRQLITETVKEVSLEMDDILEAEEADIAKALVEEYGCEVYEMTEADKQLFKDALKDYMAKWGAYFGEEACAAFDIELS